MRRGRLITIEGLDGSGKSTLAASLHAELRARGLDLELLREPGGVAVSEQIRTIVHDPALTVTPRAEALLYAAARAQLVEEVLEPLLAGGCWVLLDRFLDSSLAYQGAGRRLGVQAIAAINEFATTGLAPDRTLLLEIDPLLGRDRLARRGGAADRLEREPADFFERVAAAYRDLAEEHPERIRRLDASAPPAQVVVAALEALSDLLSPDSRTGAPG